MVKIINKICIAGDSHTWGQGAADRVFQDFEIPVVDGEKRLLPFCVPSFPTLLRKYINVKSGSEAMEFSGKDISERFDCEYKMECARVRGEICINKEFDFGILICGTGIGMSISANRHKGIRAGLCFNSQMARLTREHNDANILCLGARIIGDEVAFESFDVFSKTEFTGGRHLRRIEKIDCEE